MKYNATTDFITKFKLPLVFTKVMKKDRIIAGYASVEVVDRQNDMIPIHALEESFTRFSANNFEHALIQFFHSHINVGKLIAEYTDEDGVTHTSHVDETGLYVVAKIRDDIKKANEAWAMVESGELRAFSIGGEALVRVSVCDVNHKCHQSIEKMDLFEISLVDRPANQLCFFGMLKGGKFIELLKFLNANPVIPIEKGIVIHKECDCKDGDKDVTPAKIEYEKSAAEMDVEIADIEGQIKDIRDKLDEYWESQEQVEVAKEPTPEPKWINSAYKELDELHRKLEALRVAVEVVRYLEVDLNKEYLTTNYIARENIYSTLKDNIAERGQKIPASGGFWAGITLAQNNTNETPVYDLVLLRSDYSSLTLDLNKGDSGSNPNDSNASSTKEQKENTMVTNDENLEKGGEERTDGDEIDKSAQLEALVAQQGKAISDIQGVLSTIQASLAEKKDDEKEVEKADETEEEETVETLTKEDVESIATDIAKAMFEKRMEEIVGGETEDKTSVGENITKDGNNKADEPDPLNMSLQDLRKFDVSQLLKG
ncbi:MAG: HK97 family phage prohead protease [Planctomycetota bacterium]|jgi:HK97 family phage prohead protease